jgi:hypothetical protein
MAEVSNLANPEYGIAKGELTRLYNLNNVRSESVVLLLLIETKPLKI